MENAVIGEPRKISVIVNIWGKDNATSLYRSLQSVLGQKHKPDEALIVIDGPISKELWEIIRNFSNAANFLVKQIEIPNASGLWNARNMGIQSAEHELIAVHDADDVMHPDRLKIQLDQILSAEIDVLGSPVYEFDAVNERVLGLRMLAGNDQLSKKMIWQNVINHSSVMLRKSAVVGVGGYRNVHLAEDYDLWLRLMCAGKNLCTSDFVLQAFSVDGQLNKRRGGTKFIASEFILHRLVRSTKLQNILVSWIRLVLRLSYRLGPKFSRQIHRSRVQVKQFKNSAINLEEFLNNPPLNINLIS
jgi:glycosyltransferase involved in cell wall biosynthesis